MRHRREDKHGHYLYKRALFKVFVGKRVFKIPFVAKPGQGLSEANIAEFEERVIDHIEKHFSRLEFRRVVVGPNQVNFIACGTRPAPKPQKTLIERVAEEVKSESHAQTNEGLVRSD